MSVYIDTLIDYGWKFGPSCHMMADSMEELYLFAESIGLKRSWLDNSGVMPHFDLVASKRKLAVTKGAIEIDRKEAGRKIDEYKVSNWSNDREAERLNSCV